MDDGCQKCGYKSGNDWSQCGRVCPIPGSPHYDPKWQAKSKTQKNMAMSNGVQRHDRKRFGLAVGQEIHAAHCSYHSWSGCSQPWGNCATYSITKIGFLHRLARLKQEYQQNIEEIDKRIMELT